MIKILFNTGLPQNGLEYLSDFNIVMPPFGKTFPKDVLEKEIEDATVIVACSDLNADTIKLAKNAKLIVVYGAGFDRVDINSATENNIMVCNIPFTVTVPSAEFAFSLMISLARKVVELDKNMRKLPSNHLFGIGKNMGQSLNGQTLGIVGMGRIGKQMATYARAFGMKIIYTSNSRKEECDALGDTYVSLETLLKEADFISLHCPYNSDTHHLISEKNINLIKPTAFIINTARGSVISETALLDALQNKKIAGAGLDVFENEPHINPIFASLDNVILAPHVGGNTVQARVLMAKEIAIQTNKVLAGEKPDQWLNAKG